MPELKRNKRQDQKCSGMLHCRFVEPALAYFFGVQNVTNRVVPIEFLIHNTWCFKSPNKDQYLTLTKINGIDYEYKVPYTSQTGDVDVWESVDIDGLSINIIIGIDSFYITDIAKIEENNP